jgi:hypothetical protein
LSDGSGHKKTGRLRRTGFQVFWNGSPSRDLLSEAKKIPMQGCLTPANRSHSKKKGPQGALLKINGLSIKDLQDSR